jgi:hypothetical protein
MGKIEIWTDDVDIETLNSNLIDYRSKAELIFYWTAPCNCGQNIQHNDGGNYHSVLKFYKFNIDNKEIYILVKSDTRDFYGDKSYVLYHSENWEKHYILLELEEWESLLHSEIIEF